MANICYTQYRFEGPEGEIRNIGKHFLQAFSRHSYDEADEETKRFVDREFYEQHLNNIIEVLYPDCDCGCRGAIRGKITEESYRSLGDGQLVLSFEAESSYVRSMPSGMPSLQNGPRTAAITTTPRKCVWKALDQ